MRFPHWCHADSVLPRLRMIHTLQRDLFAPCRSPMPVVMRLPDMTGNTPYWYGPSDVGGADIPQDAGSTPAGNRTLRQPGSVVPQEEER